MAELSLQVLGPFEARQNGHLIADLHQREGEHLLAYLAMHPGTDFSYRALATLFWPAEARIEGRNTFPSTRQAVYVLKKHLGEDGERLKSSGKGHVRLDLDGAQVDFVTMHQLAKSESPADWERALQLGGAELLEGWSDPWVVEARARQQRLCERLRQQLVQTAPEQAPVLVLEPTGGAVPPNSPFYVLRDADRELTRALERGDSIVLIRGPRQIGKTSLLARGLEQARAAGAIILLTDFQALSERYLETPERFFQHLIVFLSMQLGRPYRPDQDWDMGLDPLLNLELFLQNTVLTQQGARVLWGMDEVDRLRNHTFSVDFFGLIRSWHNRRALQPHGPWSKLTVLVSYATEAHLLIPGLNQSPFNVGTAITLDDFTAVQVYDLNTRYERPLKNTAEHQSFYRCFGGHPFLTRRGFDELARSGGTWSELDAVATQEEGPFRDHLRRLLMFLQTDPLLAEAFLQVLRGEDHVPLEMFYRLRSGGLVSGQSVKHVRVRCQLYSNYFQNHLEAGMRAVNVDNRRGA